jgi:hypothetical protein
MNKNRKTRRKPYWEMTTAELRKVTREYEQEHVGLPGKPLSPAQSKQFERARKKLGRPVKGLGHKVISVSIERGLLTQVDALARRRKLTRAELIARGLHFVLKSVA